MKHGRKILEKGNVLFCASDPQVPKWTLIKIQVARKLNWWTLGTKPLGYPWSISSSELLNNSSKILARTSRISFERKTNILYTYTTDVVKDTICPFWSAPFFFFKTPHMLFSSKTPPPFLLVWCLDRRVSTPHLHPLILVTRCQLGSGMLLPYSMDGVIGAKLLG